VSYPILPFGIRTHNTAVCTHKTRPTKWCCIHAPSTHKLSESPLFIDTNDTGAPAYRICEHGQYHPDPDSRAFIYASWPEGVRGRMTHRNPRKCDGCC